MALWAADGRHGWAVVGMVVWAACTGADATGDGLDGDGDGWAAAVDCDDGDAAVHPGAAELCDGVDQNCDGAGDDGALDAVLLFPDGDGDGFGDDDGGALRCGVPPGWVPSGGDCDDGDASVSPAALEICNGRDDDCDGSVDEDVPTDGGSCADPGPPVFPATVGIVSLAVRTGDGANDGTDANDLSLCLSASDCFPLDNVDVNDFRRGEIDVFHFEDVGLPRAAIDRVEIRSQNGSDRWVPACLELQLDGEPVYCEDAIGEAFGNAAGEVESWIDPSGLHTACSSCYPEPVTHGPMVGAVESDVARLWVRTDATRRVALRLGETSELASPPVAFAYPSPHDDYAAHFEVHGLEPERTYFYAFDVEGVASATRSFHTAPAPFAPSTFRMAFGSCSKADAQPIFAQIASLAPDLFLFLGDAHYGNTSDLGSLRWFYRWGLERPQRAALVGSTPTLAIWDDHDFTGNNEDGTAPGKAVSLRVFGEYWANPSAGLPSVPGVFFRHAWGDVELFLLDDRYYRGLDGSLLGAAQTAWLREALASSTATFKLVASGSQFTSHGSSDSWAVFPTAREAFFDSIRDEGIAGVVLLSGDVHRAEIRRIDRSADGAYDLYELTSSPLANVDDPCGADAELLACEDDDDFFIAIDSDTAAPDPWLRATIVDAQGEARYTLELFASELQP